MTVKGIDVSQWQGNINFDKVKADGIGFVILRAGYGRLVSQKDPQFESNYAKAKAAGLNVGAYWYSYAQTIDDVKSEASACLEVIKNKKFEYPIYFDLEEQGQFNKGRTFCDNLIKTFCGIIETNGYYAGLYISRSPLQTYISSNVAARYALWIAEYGSKCQYYANGYGMWQYSSTGRVNGINGKVDMDECYVDYPSLIKKIGLNGYPKKETVTSDDLKVLDAEGFSEGDKNDGVLAYKQLLIVAHNLGLLAQKVDNNNSYGAGTVKATNELLGKLEKIQNGIAGSHLIMEVGRMIKEAVKK